MATKKEIERYSSRGKYAFKTAAHDNIYLCDRRSSMCAVPRKNLIVEYVSISMSGAADSDNIGNELFSNLC